MPSSLTFAETFLYEKEACSYIDNVYFAAVHKKNNISTSCILNGFKYILIISGLLFFAFFQLILITNKPTPVIHIISWLSILNPDYIRNLIFLNCISTTG